MSATASVITYRVAWWLLWSLGAMFSAGCTASQTTSHLDPQILQVHRIIDSWTGEYRGRVDHKRWYLSTLDQVVPPNQSATTDGWQGENDLRVELSIRFVPDERGGQLHLSLVPADTFQVQPWNFSFINVSEDLEPRKVDRRPLELDFRVPQDILLLEEHKLEGVWTEKAVRNEQEVEFSFERVSGEASGVLKYHSKFRQEGDYPLEEKHEMALRHLWKKDAGVTSNPVVVPAKP